MLKTGLDRTVTRMTSVSKLKLSLLSKALDLLILSPINRSVYFNMPSIHIVKPEAEVLFFHV